jgi:hypothetical protein
MNSRQQERAERRLAAILAADVAGYSRLMGADEEGTHERLKALRRELLDPKTAGGNRNPAGNGCHCRPLGRRSELLSFLAPF